MFVLWLLTPLTPLLLGAAYLLGLFRRESVEVDPEDYEAASRVAARQWWLVPVLVVPTAIAPLILGVTGLPPWLHGWWRVILPGLVGVALLWFISRLPVDKVTPGLTGRQVAWALGWIAIPLLLTIGCFLTQLVKCDVSYDASARSFMCVVPGAEAEFAEPLLPSISDLVSLVLPALLVLFGALRMAPSRWRLVTALHASSFVAMLAGVVQLGDLALRLEVAQNYSADGLDGAMTGIAPFPEWAVVAAELAAATVLLLALWHLGRLLVPPRLVVPVTPAPH